MSRKAAGGGNVTFRDFNVVLSLYLMDKSSLTFVLAVTTKELFIRESKSPNYLLFSVG